MQTSPIPTLDANWIKSFLAKHTRHAPVLLAVSGGLDSMVLWDLVHTSGFEYAVAHVNYHLRGEESDADAQLVTDIAKLRGIELHLLDDTSIAKGDTALQSTARNVRYKFFDTLATRFPFTCTAHHADDQAETILLQLGRGGGPSALAGISAAGEELLRPLLPFSKEELSAYAKTYDVAFRQDESNATDDYLRNRVRHHLLPMADKMFDSLRQNLSRAADQQQTLLSFASAMVQRVIEESTSEEWPHALDRNKLMATSGLSYVIHELLRKHDFQSDMINSVCKAIGDEVSQKRQFLNRSGSIRLVLAGQTMHLEQTAIIDAFEIEIDKPGEYASPLGTMIVTEGEGDYFGESETWVPTLSNLIWRTTTPSDSIAISDSKSKVAKRVLAEAKLTSLTQQTTSALVQEKTVLWIVSVRKSTHIKTKKAKMAGYHLRFNAHKNKLSF